MGLFISWGWGAFPIAGDEISGVYMIPFKYNIEKKTHWRKNDISEI